MGIPPFHRVNTEPISHRAAGDCNGLGQGGTGAGGENLLINGKIEPQLGQPNASAGRRFNCAILGNIVDG